MLLLEEWIRERRKAALLTAEEVLLAERYDVLRELYRGGYHPLSQLHEFTLGTGRVCLVTSDAGIGKTFLCHQLVSQQCQVGVEGVVVPIYIPITKQTSVSTLSIENIVRAQGISEGDIPQLKAEGRLLIILDGFADDERYVNLYVGLKLYEWPKAKLIVTCRSSHLFHLSQYQHYFEPMSPQGQRLGKLTEIKMPLLSETQLELYKAHIQAHAELGELLRHPFFLRCVMRNAEVSSGLLEGLLRAWYSWHEKRFREMGRLGVNETLGDKSFGYGIALARQMRKTNVDVIVYKPRSMLFQTDNDSGSAFFSRHDSRLNLLREMCPLVEVGSKRYQFLGQSLLLYFADHKTIAALSLQEETVVKPRDIGEVPRTEPMPVKPANGLANHYLNKRCMTDDSNIMQWFADRVVESTKFKELLFKLVLASRTDPMMETAAANAITILNRAGVSFSGLDLQNIRVRYANLEGANFDSAILSGADLRDVNLQNAWLRNADLSGAKMQGVKFGEKPYFKFPKDAIGCFSGLDGRITAVSVDTEANHLSVFEIQQNKILFKTTYLKPVGFEPNVAISKNLSRVAYYENNSIKLWDIANNTLINLIELHSDDSNPNIILSDDGEILGLRLIRKIQIREVRSDKIISEFRIDHFPYFAFTSDLSMFAGLSATDNISIYNGVNGRLLSTLDDDNSNNQSQNDYLGGIISTHGNQLGFSASGKLLFKTSFNVQVWLVSEKRRLCTIDKTSEYAVISPNEEYIAVALDKLITIWNIETGVLVKSLGGNLNRVACLVFNKNGHQLFSADINGIARLWDIDTRKVRNSNMRTNKDKIGKVILSSDGCMGAVARSGTLEILSVKNWQVIVNIVLDRWKITDMQFSPDNKYLAVLGEITSSVTLIDVSKFPIVKVFPEKIRGDCHLQKSRGDDRALTIEDRYKDGYMVSQSFQFHYSGVETDTVEIFKDWARFIYQKFGAVNLFSGYGARSIAVSNTHIITGNSDGSYHLWLIGSNRLCHLDYGAKKCSNVFVEENDSNYLYKNISLTNDIYAPGIVIFNQEGKVFALTKDDRVLICCLGTSQDIITIINEIPVELPNRSGVSTQLSLYSKLKDHIVAIVNDGIATLWHGEPMQYIQFFPRSSTDKLTCVSLCPCGQYLVLGSERELYVWEVDSKQFLAILKGFNGEIKSISWVEKNEKLFFATSSSDNVTRYWEVVGKAPNIHILLRWSDSQLTLVADGANINGVEIDDLENKTLLTQGGAVTKQATTLQEYGIFATSPALVPREKLSSRNSRSERNNNDDEDDAENIIDPVLSKAKTELEQGDLCLGKKDMTTAIDHYQYSAELAQNYIPRLRLAYCYWLRALKISDQNYIVKSRENFEAALELVANTHLYVLYALFLCQQKHFDNALPYLERVFNTILIEDNYQFNYSAYDSVLLPKEIKEETDEAVDLAIGAIPLAYYLIVNCYCSLNQKTNAIKYLDEFSKWVGNNASALHYSLLGYCHKLLEQSSEAVACFSQALEMKQNYELAKRNLQFCSSLVSLNMALSNLQSQSQASFSAQGEDDEANELQRALSMSMSRN